MTRMPIFFRRLLALTLPCLALSACADYPDAQHPVMDGWRVATIDHIVTSDESTPLVAFEHDCRSLMSTGPHGTPNWVMLHYRRPPGDVYRVVPVADPQTVHEGDSVYVQSKACEVAIDHR